MTDHYFLGVLDIYLGIDECFLFLGGKMAPKTHNDQTTPSDNRNYRGYHFDVSQ